ncbi:hypothetical protein V6N13_136769 [Hibiscus sabdariffa]
MEDTLIQDLIEIKEVEDRPVFEDKGAREYVIEQSMVAAIPEPYIGMEFKSPDDAQQYYNNYARSKGFGTRKNRISRSKINKAMIAREFVCSKEGLRANKYVKREDRVTVAPDEIREGCKAMILVSKKEEGKWIVSRFHTEHNHALASPMSTRFIRSHRTKTKVQKDLMDVLDDSGIRPSKIASILSHESGGLGNLNMTEHDIFNYLSRKRQKQLEKGDAQIMLDYFRGCQSKNPGLSEKATRSSKHYDLAIRGIKNLCDELDTLAIDIVNEGKKPASIDDSRMLEDDNVLYSGTTLRDPVHVISKGRPPSLRKKSSVEESSKKSKTCSSCNRKGHTKRTCERHQPNFESKSISTSQIVDVTQD